MDLSTILGLLIGLGGILFGNLLEGGHFAALFQGTAAVIVFGGTFGATAISNTFEDMKLALYQLRAALRDDDENRKERVSSEIVQASQLARKESILALEKSLNSFSEPFMKNVFRFVVDGVDPTIIRNLYEEEIRVIEDSKMTGVKVWSDAGGYAPTIGIIGAVLGLIQVMANLTDTTSLGKGIAVAFVATIYGVGSANLIFLPIANKIRRKIEKETEILKMIVDGAVSIASGLNPYIVTEKMRAYQDHARSAEM